MSHRIIITSVIHTPAAGLTESHISTADYSFEFAPSHDLSEQEQTKRITKIRRVLEKLSTEVTAPGESAD